MVDWICKCGAELELTPLFDEKGFIESKTECPFCGIILVLRLVERESYGKKKTVIADERNIIEKGGIKEVTECNECMNDKKFRITRHLYLYDEVEDTDGIIEITHSETIRSTNITCDDCGSALISGLPELLSGLKAAEIGRKQVISLPEELRKMKEIPENLPL